MPATDKYNEVLIGVIAGLVIFLVITCMVVFILLFYQKKKFQHKKQIIDMERDFSSLGTEHYSSSLDKVAYIEHLVEKVHAFLPKLVHPEE